MLKIIGIYFTVYASSLVPATQLKRSPGNYGAWNNYCVLPPCPEHANYEVTGFFETWHGERWPTELKFTCWPGYTLVGSRFIVCYDGRWSDQTPQCVAAAHMFQTPNTYQQQFPPHQQQLVAQQQQPSAQQQPVVAQQQQPLTQQQQLVEQQQQPLAQQEQPLAQQQQLVEQQQQPLAQQEQPLAQQQQLVAQQQQPLAQQQPLVAQNQPIVPPPQGSTMQSENLEPKLQQCMLQLQECSQQTQPPEPMSQLLSSQQNPPPQKEQLSETPARTGGTCIVPENLENVEYSTFYDSKTTPGDILRSAVFVFTCKTGYELVGAKIQTCFKGIWSDFIPRCKVADDEVINKENIAANETDTCPIGCKLVSYGGSSYLTESEPKKSGRLISDCGKPSARYITHHFGGSGGYSAISREKRGRDLPWHVGIYDKSGGTYNQICGGSVISKNQVISAAHCFWDDLEKQLPASQYAVGAGKAYREWNHSYDSYNTQPLDVKEIKIPPRYQHNMANFQEDIALVTVMNDFKFNEYVRPVCLDFDFPMDSKQLQGGNIGKVGGWGLTSENGLPSSVLQIVHLPYVGIETCLAQNEPAFLSYITSDKFCAGNMNGTAVCKGDSGGGLVFSEGKGRAQRYYLRGVVSTAPKSGNDCNIYAWATFTHVLRHEHFITPLFSHEESR